ncbi:MAG: hypothetical protein FWD13_11710, partial [Treponema sp.]|nr:hypothetical protein [Treponema sp.]
YSESIDDWVDGIDLFYLHETSIQNALRTYEIIDERTNFLPFPLSRNNISYYARIDDFIYGEDEIWSLGETIIRYSLLVTANNESKVINTFKPFRWLTDADVCGYFISPCGNIILVIIAEDLGLYQHGGLLYRFVNLQL